MSLRAHLMAIAVCMLVAFIGVPLWWFSDSTPTHPTAPHVHTWDVWVSDPVTGMILHKPVQCRVCINCGLQEYRTIETSKTP